MKGVGAYLCFGLYLLLFLGETNAARSKTNGVYIVYMGALPSHNGAQRSDHAELMTSLIKRKRDSVVQTYSNGFAGFVARLSEEEAKSIAARPGVVSVFPDPVLHLHTTRSWDFLKLQTSLKVDSNQPTDFSSSTGGADTIIGILDTGIWPESESFNDEGIGPIPPHWKGKCMEGVNFTSSNCNRKIIGARYYDDPDPDPDADFPTPTPRDESGHGTHVASTAAGTPVSGASYYGLATGTAQGGSPTSRIAVYRVCFPDGGCTGSSILKAFDDAIADGVDVLSLSLGSNPGKPDFMTDPVAIGAFHAVEQGITVVCATGNDGPSPASVVNVAPWIVTVGATTIDRDFEANIVLGGGQVVKGGGINFAGLNKSTMYPLMDGRLSSVCGIHDEKAKGKIVVCENKHEEAAYGARNKLRVLESEGAVGMILIDDYERQVPSKYDTYPIAAVSQEDGAQILSYINSTSNPLATILPTVVTLNYKPAPSVAYFSSRGPIPDIKNLLKPDITAPGVAILAAWPSNDSSEALPGRDPPLFDILSGTSMSCPHVSGLAAKIKSQHPTWSPSAIRSAIMTTAIQTNNVHAPITTVIGSEATPYDIGAGEISVSGPLQPGLVYESEPIDYIQFLCDIGYDTAKIKNISYSVPKDFSCSNSSGPDGVSNMNYPSIAVSGLTENISKIVNRTVTNVGEEDSSYTAFVEAPAGLHIEVVPNNLAFTKDVKKLSFQMTFKLSVASRKDLFGSITWSNDKYKVRSPIIVSNEV